MMRTDFKEEILTYLMSETKKTKKTHVIERLAIQQEELVFFQEDLKELQKQKIVTVNHKGYIIRKEHGVIGKFYYNPKGYGFFVASRNRRQVYFIPPQSIHDALHEDVVMVTPKKTLAGKQAEAEVIKVVKRETKIVTGTYLSGNGFGFVVPDNPKINMDIYIPESENLGAKAYDKVVCKITRYPQRNRKPEGRIEEVLGLGWERGVDTMSVIREHGLRDVFPAKVIKQLEKIPETLTVEDLDARWDFRETVIFTIDGEDAKDLDDAVSIKKLKNGNFELGVHIADVAHYVKEGSRVDKEALERGVSVYLINTVLPMLPEKLSNRLCSLQPHVDRLTLSVLMELDHHGNVIQEKIGESVIRSCARLTYHEVTDFLQGENPFFAEKYPLIVEPIQMMKELAMILMKKRTDRGAIEFEFPESKITLDEKDQVINVSEYERGVANDIIEEFMIVCNETVSEYFTKEQLPFLYRIHETPRTDKMELVQNYLLQHGYRFIQKEVLQPRDVQMLLSMVRGQPEEKAVHLLILRSMQQARYHSVPKGHFGLATQYYSHFTSPIRRYPDLQIHRIIKESLHQQITEERKEQLWAIVNENAKLCSKRERIAERAEDSLEVMKKIEYMKNKIGEEMNGVVTSVATGGFVVTLDNTIETYAPLSYLKSDAFQYEKEEQRYRSMNTGIEIVLGDRVSVVVERINTETKEILVRFTKVLEQYTPAGDTARRSPLGESFLPESATREQFDTI